MKIQICRASGLPVKFSDIEAFNEASRQLYDKVKMHVVGDRNLLNELESERMNRLLTRLGKRVLQSFKLVEDLTVNGTKKSWLELVSEHGPIALAKNSETGALTAVIMDSTFGG